MTNYQLFLKTIRFKKEPNKTKIKELIDSFNDEIIDICIENKTFFDMKIDKSELYNKI